MALMESLRRANAVCDIQDKKEIERVNMASGTPLLTRIQHRPERRVGTEQEQRVIKLDSIGFHIIPDNCK